MRLRFQFEHALLKLAALGAQHVHVDTHAVALHARQHRHQRHFDLLKQLHQRRGFTDPRPQGRVQPERHVGVLGGVDRGLRDRHFAEVDLILALAGHVFVLEGFVAQVLERERVHVVARGGGVEHVGLEHGVEAEAGEPHAVIGEHVQIVFEVLPDLGRLLSLEQRLEFRQHFFALELCRRAGVIVRQRHVGAATHAVGKRHAHDLGLHGIEAGGFGVEGEGLGFLQARQPGIERVLVENGFIHPRRCARRRRGRRVGAIHAAEVREPDLELQAREQLAQPRLVRRRARQVLRFDVERHVAADGGQLARERQLRQRGAQVLAGLPGNLGRVRHERVERAVLLQPLGRSLGADAGDAGDVVGGVADEREVIDDALRRHAELPDHRVAVVDRVGHGVDEFHRPVHELRQILVAGGDERVQAGGGRLGGERTDDVVGLDALDLQQRQAHGAHDGVQRLDLAGELVRHRRAVRLVVGEQVVAEGLAAGIEHHGDAGGIVFGQQLAQHIDHAVDGAGRLAARVGEPRQGVERAVQIRRAVHQHKQWPRRRRRRGGLAPRGGWCFTIHAAWCERRFARARRFVCARPSRCAHGAGFVHPCTLCLQHERFESVAARNPVCVPGWP